MTDPIVPPFVEIPNVYPDSPDPVDPNVPLNPPMVGTASPFNRVDGQNRDEVVQSMRTWFRKIFLPWLAAWTAFWKAWAISIQTNENNFQESVAVWLNAFAATYEAYILAHTIQSVSIGEVDTGAPGTPAAATLTGPITDPVFNFTIPSGYTGYEWWIASTQIVDNATPVDLSPDYTPDANHPLQIGDIIVDSNGVFGIVWQINSPTEALVDIEGNLKGPAGTDGIATPFTVNFADTAGIPNYTYTSIGAFPQMSGLDQIITTAPCWVRIYADTAHEAADAGRAINTPIDITTDHGIFLDYVSTTDSLTKILSPGVQVSDVSDTGHAVVVKVIVFNVGDFSVTINGRTFLA